MAGRRLLYLAVLESLLVFYVAYREWLSWVALVAAAAFPLLSLLLSLPGILTVRVRLAHPGSVSLGTPVQPEIHIACFLPAPPVRCRLKLRHSITGTVTRWKEKHPLYADHCGVLTSLKGGVWVYDYLGLWRFPLRRVQCPTLTVLPVPCPIEQAPLLQRIPTTWKPKLYGFSENHELRLYRPGDDLRLLHPKLSLKTGKLILREPMELLRQKTVLTLALSGTPAQIDRKMGRLLWLSNQLLARSVPHEIRCLTAGGLESCQVTDSDSLNRAMALFLAAEPVLEDTVPPVTDAGQHFHIGGDGDAG